MTMGKHCFMQMAGFMSSLPALMSQSQDRMGFMKSAAGLWKIWQKRTDLTWIISVGKRGRVISEEFVAARTGEPLEKRLKKSDSFQRQMKSLHEASKAFTRDSVKLEGI